MNIGNAVSRLGNSIAVLFRSALPKFYTKPGLEAWQMYCHDNLISITNRQVSRLTALNPATVKALLQRDLFFTKKIQDLKTSSHFTDTEYEHLSVLRKILISKDFGSQLTTQALENQRCEIKNPFGDGFATSQESIHFRNNVSCLRFRTPQNEIFFLFQHVTSADAVYFPTRNCCFHLHHISIDLLMDAVAHICLHFGRYLNYAKNHSHNQFLGVTASHGRPYHFYYDVLLAMEQLYVAEKINQLPAIYVFDKGLFFPLKELFDYHGEITTTNHELLEQAALTQPGFHLQVGLCYSKSSLKHEEIAALDKRVIACATALADNTTHTELEEAKSHYPLIWYGVSVQKRSWLEQVDGAVEIFTNLAKRYPNMAIVIDGWTVSLDGQHANLKEINDENHVYDEIRAKLPDSIKMINLIGENSIKKLNFAISVDFFICNYATSSMYVARFAQKPGVAHFNTKMSKKAHIHYNTYMPENSDVTDIPNPDNPLPGYISYSIDWVKVQSLMNKMMQDHKMTSDSLWNTLQ